MSWGNILAITNSSGTDLSGNANHIANLNPIRYRGYFYDVETGFYYLQSRYYDPVIGRFINLDGFVTTGQGFLSYNMYAYCENNPVIRKDSNGKSWFKDVFPEIISGGGAVAATAAVADGPLPFGDIVGLGVLFLTTVATVGDDVYLSSKSISKDSTKEEAKDVVVDLSEGDNSQGSFIYRYYASKTENLAPRPGKDTDGLSFSSHPPKPGIPYVITTIEMVKCTGILTVIQTSKTHYLVVPTIAPIAIWINEGQNSRWSQALSGIVTEVG